MDLDAHSSTQNVKGKGKGPALDVEAVTDTVIDSLSSETCVICLDHISEKATALPCQHDQFDFPCLGTWIQQTQVCPLCKADVKAIRYEAKKETNKTRIFHLPANEIPTQRPVLDIQWRRARARGFHPYDRCPPNRRIRQDWGQPPAIPSKEEQALTFRKKVYQKKMYSAYVGTNRISRYRNITPQSFIASPSLVSRAKVFIRRELQVFDFLNPSMNPTDRSRDRRSSNAEFLLEYIVGILKSIDLKGSTGQAEDLLQDFLGKDNAKLFLHELEAWLRSPYERLGDWDRHVQYGSVLRVGGSSSR